MLAPAFPPENLIGARRPGRFAQHLPDFGYKPLVITASAIEPGASTAAWPVPYHHSFLDRLLAKLLGGDDWYTWAAAVVGRATGVIAQEAPVAVFSTSPPWAVHLAALRLKRAHGLPWVADFRDPLVSNLGRTRTMARMVGWLAERAIARVADAVVLNTSLRREDWQTRYPHWCSKFRVIHNGFDDDDLDPLPLPPRPSPVWIHTGSLYRGRDLGRLVDALARLVSRKALDAAPALRLVGELAADARAVLARDSYRGLEAAGLVSLCGDRLPRSEARHEARTADKLILFDHINPFGNREVPAKMYDYLRIGRPILTFTARGSEVERLLKESGIGHMCLYDDETDARVDSVLMEFSHLAPRPVAMRPEFREAFSPGRQTRQLAQIFDEVLARRPEGSVRSAETPRGTPRS